MRFVYQYRSSDNEVHTGEMCASDRDGVFAALRARGIRPSMVKESPGFFNKLFGKGKRWIAIAMLSAMLAMLAFYVVSLRERMSAIDDGGDRIERRGQIYGDPFVLQKFESESWRECLTNEGDVILARFAQPGDSRVLSEARIANPELLRLACDDDVEILASDIPEVAKMKRMVNWMKRELRSYLAAGGSFGGYLDRLYERQRTELKIYESRIRDLEQIKTVFLTTRGANADEALRQWELINGELRDLGLKTVEVPQEFFKDFVN